MTRATLHKAGQAQSPGARWLRLLMLAALLAWSTACDDTIQPLADNPESLFAVYGFLDSSADTQFVRVEALRPTVLAMDDTPARLDAEVTSTDLDTGEQIPWSDSLVVLDDGSTGHLFFAAFRPRVGGTYRLEVRRPDGRTTHATTQLPPTPDMSVSSPVGDTLNLAQRILLSNLPDRPFQVSMQYQVGRSPGQRDTFDIAYGNIWKRLSTGWEIEIQLVRDQRIILARLDLDSMDKSVLFYGLNMVVSLLSTEWNTTPSRNITNGEGFFGAISRTPLSWELTSDDVATIGFIDQQ